MSVFSEIERLEGAKSALAASIEGKGVAVPEGTKIDGMAALVDQISTGGGGGGTSGGPTYDDDVTGMALCPWTNFGSAMGELPMVPSNVRLFKWGKVVCPAYPGYFQLFFVLGYSPEDTPDPGIHYASYLYNGGYQVYIGKCKPGQQLFMNPFGMPPEPGFPLDYYIGGVEYND